MADQLLGNIAKRIDELTLEMNISWKSPNNEYTYEEKETIRVSGESTTQVGPAGATHITDVIDQTWNGAHIQCNATGRDRENRVTGEIWLL